jgi:hypothetical protein
LTAARLSFEVLDEPDARVFIADLLGVRDVARMGI